VLAELISVSKAALDAFRFCLTALGRRLTRLTNALSKKRIMLKASLALNFAHYNFCRSHSTLKVTPAMESGITNHVWSLEEMLSTISSVK
jgi:hypothetical protein